MPVMDQDSVDAEEETNLFADGVYYQGDLPFVVEYVGLCLPVGGRHEDAETGVGVIGADNCLIRVNLLKLRREGLPGGSGVFKGGRRSISIYGGQSVFYHNQI